MEDEGLVREHIETCSRCSRKLERQTNGLSANPAITGNAFGTKDCEDMDEASQIRVLRKARWKNRLVNSLVAIALFLLLIFISYMLTNQYYHGGNPSRSKIYNDVIATTHAVTTPNLFLRSLKMDIKPYFAADTRGVLFKQVGRDHYHVGELDLSFVFNRPGKPQYSYTIYDSLKPCKYFRYPTAGLTHSDWDALRVLPEGTVAEAYVSFGRFFETDEVLQIFENLDMDIVWFAADTGLEGLSTQDYRPPIGFPFQPWLSFMDHGDSHPYSNGELRNSEFIEMLQLLIKHQTLAERVTLAMLNDLKLEERFDYIEENGVKIYGAVITGPSRELLKLEEEEWVFQIRLGEVKLWNWHN